MRGHSPLRLLVITLYLILGVLVLYLYRNDEMTDQYAARCFGALTMLAGVYSLVAARRKRSAARREQFER